MKVPGADRVGKFVRKQKGVAVEGAKKADPHGGGDVGSRA